jgi:hypothetical protein
MNNSPVTDFLVPTKMDVVVNLSFDQERSAGDEVAVRTAVQTLSHANVNENLIEFVASGTSLNIPTVKCCCVTDTGNMPIITEDGTSSDGNISDSTEYSHMQSAQDCHAAHRYANQSSSSSSTYTTPIKQEFAGAFMVNPLHPDPLMLPPPELPSPLTPIPQPTDYYSQSQSASSFASAVLDGSSSHNLPSSSSSSLQSHAVTPTATATAAALHAGPTSTSLDVATNAAAFLTTITPPALHAGPSSTSLNAATNASAAAASAARAALATSAAVQAALEIALANAAIDPTQPANDNPTSITSTLSPSSLTNTLGHAAFRARMLAQGYTLVQLRDSRGRYKRGPYQYVRSGHHH